MDQSSPISFSEIARRTACMLGTPTAFAAACAVAISGSMFGYPDTWQLVINDNRDVPYGLSGAEHAEPRCEGTAPEA